MGTSVPKQFLKLKGKPVIFYAIKAFLDCLPEIRIVLVVPEIHRGEATACLRLFPADKERIIVKGGGLTRFHSVQNGLKHISTPGIVFVHDGVRPLVNAALIQRCYRQAMQKGSAIPAVPVTDSIRCWDGNRFAIMDRTKLRALQTPQTFKTELLLPAYRQEYQEIFTDEATVVEAAGMQIHLTEGLKKNIKITTPEDLAWAEKILEL